MRKKHRSIVPARARPPVIYERRPLDIPEYGGFPEALRGEIESSDRTLGSLCALPPGRVLRAPVQDFAALWHPLSEAAEARRVVVGAETRSDGEREALTSFESGDRAGGDFRAELARLNARLTEGRSRWRTGPICLHADAQGAVISFPHPRFIEQQVAKLHRVIDRRSDGPALFRAVAALALVVNAHAFTDGNGRTARTLFNHVLRQGGLRPDVYVPVFEMASKSRGGFEISLRAAEIFGKWEPLFEYFTRLVSLHARMATLPEASAAANS